LTKEIRGMNLILKLNLYVHEQPARVHFFLLFMKIKRNLSNKMIASR